MHRIHHHYLLPIYARQSLHNVIQNSVRSSPSSTKAKGPPHNHDGIRGCDNGDWCVVWCWIEDEAGCYEGKPSKTRLVHENLGKEGRRLESARCAGEAVDESTGGFLNGAGRRHKPQFWVGIEIRERLCKCSGDAWVEWNERYEF